MAALEKPILMVRVNAEARERVIKLLRDNVKGKREVNVLTGESPFEIHSYFQLCLGNQE